VCECVVMWACGCVNVSVYECVRVWMCECVRCGCVWVRVGA